MIQLGKFAVGGCVVGWLTPTTYIQLFGSGSKSISVLPVTLRIKCIVVRKILYSFSLNLINQKELP